MSINGRIFDVQRGSFVDGPGIRTTVFFKGCNLRCAWCHNPESWISNPQLLYYEEKCSHCGVCESVCPQNEAWDFSKCNVCGTCSEYCPNHAREKCGKTVDVDALMYILEQDIPFFSASEGGVTASGGECMLQIDFLETLLKRCREKKIHTAVDTAGNVPFCFFERILCLTDLFLFDVKCADSELHRKWTGTDNRIILENLSRLANTGARIWIRIPVVSGVNDNVQEMERIGLLLRPIRPEKIELLPYHAMGLHKYRASGYGEPVKFSAINAETFEELKQYLLSSAQ